MPSDRHKLEADEWPLALREMEHPYLKASSNFHHRDIAKKELQSSGRKQDIPRKGK
jgi:hypothetical protein